MTRISMEEALRLAKDSKSSSIIRIVRISCVECNAPLGAMIAKGFNLKQFMVEELTISLCHNCLQKLQLNLSTRKDAMYADTRFDKQMDEMK